MHLIIMYRITGRFIMADNSPSSSVDMCNLSLTELKVNPISSLDQEGSSVAELCKRHYDARRKALLRTHVWNFSKTEEALARASDGTSVSFDDVYPLTSAFIRFLSIGDVLIGTKDMRYDIRSIRIGGVFKRCIVIDNGGAATLNVLYIRNVTSVSEFDPLFVQLFKFELANDIAPGITLKPSIKISIQKGLDDARLQARGIDGQERPPVRISNSRFLAARRHGVGRLPVVQVQFDSD